MFLRYLLDLLLSMDVEYLADVLLLWQAYAFVPQQVYELLQQADEQKVKSLHVLEHELEWVLRS